jgi:hypothetical protein
MFKRYVFAAAAHEYKQLLARMRKAQAPEPNGKRNAHERASEAAHVRAAKQVIKEWKLAMDWQSFLNQISSEK